MSDVVKSTRRRLAYTFLGVAAVFGLAAWLIPWRAVDSDKTVSFPVPPFSATRFLNTGSDAHFLGTDACAECHRGNHRSYMLTEHSRALADLDLAAEPPDGSFHHAASERWYRVYRQEGQMRHQEIIKTDDGKEIAKVDVPIRYLVGSGHFTRSYLFEIDGFLHESPITWYTSKKKWDISPGYDAPRHWAFERPVDVDCLTCHAGRAEPKEGTLHRINLHELAIGCESCHGPGSLHQARQREKRAELGADDLSIVHPGKLPRPLMEAICATCHLSGPATVPLRGRRFNDYRPGRPLTDYRVDYRFESGNEQMTVVGHIEQLRRSVCYQKSPELSCLTCHEPHARERPKDTVAFYRHKCLSCHAVQACQLTEVERRQKNASDNCAACHMPRGDTDIPHVAFTHHRIGRHDPKTAAVAKTSAKLPALIPTDDISHLSEVDRQRSLGLAYLAVFQNPTYAEHAEAARDRALEILDAVQAAGFSDGEIAGGLAEIWWSKDRDRAAPFARKALEAKDVTLDVKARVLLMLASAEMQERQFSSALGRLEELVRMRRYAEDWRLLGMCHLELERPKEALKCLQQALAIRPSRPTIHAGLADVFQRLGDVRRADEHKGRAGWLFHRQID